MTLRLPNPFRALDSAAEAAEFVIKAYNGRPAPGLRLGDQVSFNLSWCGLNIVALQFRVVDGFFVYDAGLPKHDRDLRVTIVIGDLISGIETGKMPVPEVFRGWGGISCPQGVFWPLAAVGDILHSSGEAWSASPEEKAIMFGLLPEQMSSEQYKAANATFESHIAAFWRGFKGSELPAPTPRILLAMAVGSKSANEIMAIKPALEQAWGQFAPTKAKLAAKMLLA